uniref:Putative secreted protein n=1 Tax=Anopheles marajoara TaxID=58244 RepID=A0A2M4CBX9_9DIPT
MYSFLTIFHFVLLLNLCYPNEFQQRDVSTRYICLNCYFPLASRSASLLLHSRVTNLNIYVNVYIYFCFIFQCVKCRDVYV